MKEKKRRARSVESPRRPASPPPLSNDPADRLPQVQQASEERFRIVSELTSDFAYTFAVAPDGTLTLEWMTGAFARITGYQPEEIWPHGNWMSLLHPDDLPLAQERLRTVLAGQPDETEARIITRQGEARWVRIHTRPQWDEAQGRVVRVYGAVQDVTSSKQVEAMQLASEIRYRRLFEAAQDGILILDAATGQIADVNPFLTQLLGYSHQELLGKRLWDIGSFQDLDASKFAFAELQHHGQIRYENLPLETRDGRRIDVEFVSNLYLVNGQAVIQCNIRDITTRRETEEALRQSEQLYRTLAESAQDAIFIVNREGFLEYTNLAAAQVFGSAPEELVGKQPEDLFDQGTFARQRRNLQAVFESGQPAFVVGNARVGEQEIWQETSLIPLHGEGGEVRAVMGIARDVTARRRAEEALQQSEERYRTLAESTEDVIYIIDRQGGVTYVNRAGAHLFGREPQDLIGKPLETFFDPGAFSRQRNNLQVVFASGQPCSVENQNTIAGREVWQETLLIPLQDDTGAVRAVMGVSRDITERKKTEEALRATQQQLAVILDTMHETVSYLTPDQRIIWANRAAGESVGLGLTQMVGRHCYELWGLGGTPCPGCPVLAAVATGQSQENESLHPDGRIWHVYGHPVYGTDGEITGLVDVAWDVTARRQAEDALRTSEHQYRTTINSMGDMIHVVDPDLRFVLYNKAMQQWIEDLHLDPEVIGHTVFDTFPFLPERVQEEYQHVFRTGEMLITEDSTWVGGREYITETRKIPIFEEGKVVRVVTVVDDITDRKRAEQELRASEERYRGVVEDQTELICRFRSDGTLTFVNEAYCRYFGKPREELIGQSFLPLIPPEDWDKVQGQIASLSRETPVVTYEDRGLLRSGEARWQQWTDRAIFDEQGQVVEYQSVGRDITERKGAEQVLWQTKMVVEHSPVILYRLRAEEGWPFEFISENVTQTGYTADDLLSGRVSFSALIHPEDFSRVVSEMEEHAERGVDTFRQEYRVILKSGIVAWFEDWVVIVRGPDGRVTHYQGVLLDITENRRLEEQFRQAQKMETVGRLAGGIAHDFNNFLTAIRGYAGLVYDTLRSEDPVRADIAQVLQAAERAAGLTGQLLAFSRRQIIETRPANLNDLVLETEKMVHRLIGEDIELSLVLASNLGLVRVDSGQITQALVNLVVNARDAMPDGGVLTIETANVSLDQEYANEQTGVTPGPFALLMVSDTGVGMAEEVKTHLFEPFFTTKEAGRGTGLGLATVYGIVKQHQGHITVQSAPGQGTTVRIYLPQIKEKSRPAPRRGAAESMPRGNETVLVVEDEPAVRALMVRVLRSVGYTVLEAADGNQAIQSLRQRKDKIHLLLTDVVMPQLDGKMLASLLQDAHEDLKVLYVSGYATDVLARYGVLEEGVALLHKPFTGAALAGKVREVLDGEERPGNQGMEPAGDEEATEASDP